MTKLSMSEEEMLKRKYTRPYEKRIADLEKENAELSMKRKAERKIFQGIVEKKNDQLTKAKEIIKKFSEFVNNEIEYDPEHPQEHTDQWNKLCAEAEQFLNEVEK